MPKKRSYANILATLRALDKLAARLRSQLAGLREPEADHPHPARPLRPTELSDEHEYEYVNETRDEDEDEDDDEERADFILTSLDELIRSALVPLPLTAHDLARRIGRAEAMVNQRLSTLAEAGLTGHFLVRPEGGLTTSPLWFWRPRPEVAKPVRREIIAGLLMRRWWSNRELVAAADARYLEDKRAVDNVITDLRRADVVWRTRNKRGRHIYQIDPNRRIPPPNMDGRIDRPDRRPRSRPQRR